MNVRTSRVPLCRPSEYKRKQDSTFDQVRSDVLIWSKLLVIEKLARTNEEIRDIVDAYSHEQDNLAQTFPAASKVVETLTADEFSGISFQDGECVATVNGVLLQALDDEFGVGLPSTDLRHILGQLKADTRDTREWALDLLRFSSDRKFSKRIYRVNL